MGEAGAERVGRDLEPSKEEEEEEGEEREGTKEALSLPRHLLQRHKPLCLSESFPVCM